MSRHLSSDEISAIVAGQACAENAAHLESCAVCRLEVGQLEEALGRFRGAVRGWSDSQFHIDALVRPRRFLWPSLAYAGVIVLILVASLVSHRFAGSRDNFESDTQLLKKVNADVSRAAPQGMETLLVAR